jgi:F1F0 ATPase subunit 2
VTGTIGSLLLAGLAGMVLGALYFEGLWLTTRWITTTRLPGLLLAASFGLRAALLVGGLYLVMADSWLRLAVGLLGVMAARSVIVRRHQPRPAPAAGAGSALWS